MPHCEVSGALPEISLGWAREHPNDTDTDGRTSAHGAVGIEQIDYGQFVTFDERTIKNLPDEIMRRAVQRLIEAGT